MPRPQAVNLMSAGMDSFLVWKLFGQTQPTINLYVEIDHVYQSKELKALQHIQEIDEKFNYETVKAAPIGSLELESGIIPLRNTHLVLAAAQLGDIIFMGVVKDEVNSDKSPEFMSAMQTVLNISWRPQYWTEGRQFLVTSPLRTRTKAEWVGIYIKSGLPLAPLLATVSCYHPVYEHCGECPSCFKRWVALTLNELEGNFSVDPERSDYAQESLDKARRGVYPEDRAREIMEVM